MSDAWVEALACAMAIAPTAYARNRMFAFYDQAAARRARARARAMRALARELAGRLGRVAGVELAPTKDGWLLRFRIPSVRMGRVAELRHAELACVAHLCGVLGGATGWAPAGMRDVLERTLARLPPELRRAAPA